MLRNFPLYVSQYRLRGLAAEISSLNTYRRALQSISATLKEQAGELQSSLDTYNCKLEELLEESLDQVESFSTVGEPELKRAQSSTQLLSALCFGTMLRIEEQKISEADDQSTAFNSALQLIEAFATDKEQKYFVQPISKKSNRFEELRTNYFSNEVLICDVEQKPRILCGQLSEQFLNDPGIGLLFPEDVLALCDYVSNSIDNGSMVSNSEPKGSNQQDSNDNHGNVSLANSEERKHDDLVELLHQLNRDVINMLKLFNAENTDAPNSTNHDNIPHSIKNESSLNSSAVENSRIEDRPGNGQKDQSTLDDRSKRLFSLFRNVNLSALRSLSEYLNDVHDKITHIWAQNGTDSKLMDKSAENSDDIDDKSPDDFLDGIISNLVSTGDVGELFGRMLNTARISNDPSDLVKETPAIKEIIDIVQKIKTMIRQKEKLDGLISTITTSTSTISSTSESSFKGTESREYLEIFNSAAGDFQSMILYLGSARDIIHDAIDALEKSLTKRFAGFITKMAHDEHSEHAGDVSDSPFAVRGQDNVESFSDTVTALRNILKTIPAKVERWESQVKAKVDAYAKEQAQLTNSTTIAKYSGMLLEHKQTIEQMLDTAHHEIDEILEVGLEYSNQACSLYLEQLKLTATIRALPCSDTSKHILSSLMVHKRCKKCKTLDWTMCRIEDGFLCCTSCAQSETGKWVRVVVS
ncbi:Hypothetical protein DHA2_151757 [Giardia duodenalis]|uniref:Uncharacterized protein n=1 Tax=Giardia intestinalis TaxID=5741 RepID=V6TEM4_GIAIN|nr:Hypothetical protein DHA2_151757 [Giardia intestinalis]